MAFTATLEREARATERHPVALDGTLRDSEWQPIDVSVEDISADGFRAIGPAGFAAGACVSIGLPGLGTRQALVMRASGGEYGCRFHQRLTADELSATVVAVVTAPIPFRESARAALLLQTALPPVARFDPRLRVAALLSAAALGWGVLLALRTLLG